MKTMSKKRPQRTMNLIAAGVISAAALVGGWGWFSHWQEAPQLDKLSNSANNATAITSKSTGKFAGNVESNAQVGSVLASDIWGRSLQNGFRAEAPTTIAPPKPPIVEAVAPAVSPPPAISDLGLRLVGTILEEGRSMAIAIDGSGTLDFRGEGDLLRLQPDGIRIDKVSKESVLVSYQGKSSTWQMGQSLQFQTTASLSGQEPIPLTTTIMAENSSFVQPTPEIMAQTLDQPPSAMPTNTDALPKMSVEDELDMLNSPKPLDPF
jgi:hypothetical protein